MAVPFLSEHTDSPEQERSSPVPRQGAFQESNYVRNLIRVSPFPPPRQDSEDTLSLDSQESTSKSHRRTESTHSLLRMLFPSLSKQTSRASTATPSGSGHHIDANEVVDDTDKERKIATCRRAGGLLVGVLGFLLAAATLSPALLKMVSDSAAQELGSFIDGREVNVELTIKGRKTYFYVPASSSSSGAEAASAFFSPSSADRTGQESRKRPAVFVFHGSDECALDMINQTHFTPFADERNFVVVYPEMEKPGSYEWGYDDGDLEYLGEVIKRLTEEESSAETVGAEVLSAHAEVWKRLTGLFRTSSPSPSSGTVGHGTSFGGMASGSSQEEKEDSSGETAREVREESDAFRSASAFSSAVVPAFHVDRSKIFAVGHSAGATFSLFAGNNWSPQLFAKVAAVEGAVGQLPKWELGNAGVPTLLVWNHADPVLREYSPEGGEPGYLKLTVTTLRRHAKHPWVPLNVSISSSVDGDGARAEAGREEVPSSTQRLRVPSVSPSSSGMRIARLSVAEDEKQDGAAEIHAKKVTASLSKLIRRTPLPTDASTPQAERIEYLPDPVSKDSPNAIIDAPPVTLVSFTTDPGQHTWASRDWCTISATEEAVKFFLDLDDQ